MKKVLTIMAIVGLFFIGTVAGAQEEAVLFSFENGTEGFEIPDWAYEKPDHVQQDIRSSENFASEGNSSLEIDCEFPGGRWTGAIVEIMQYFDWTDYSTLACDLYLPAGAPLGLKGKIILTVGETWKFVEMNSSTPLLPGEWVTVTGSIEPGSYDWKRVIPDEKFAEDIRKVAIRVESNRKPKYSGPIYVDNIRVGR